MSIAFQEVARLAGTKDNVGIALQQLEAGLQIATGDGVIVLRHSILEGHRFAIRPIAPHTSLLSWNLPFAIATRPIAAGDAVMNVKTLLELQSRDLAITLPPAANFRDHFERYELSADRHTAPPQPTPTTSDTTFMGYKRPAGRGVGTRNVIILLATNAHASSFVTALEARMADVAAHHPTLDGIKAVAHTEGSTTHANNRDLLLRTLAGFVVHSNVAAVLLVDYGDGVVNNATLAAYMDENDYPLTAVEHAFLTVRGGFEEELASAETIVRGWLGMVGEMKRSAESIQHLKIALQCGGSDAFSGISGNPLIGRVAHQLVQQGGGAVLAETDELIGAESYIVQNADSRTVAEQFLQTVERFKQWAGQHGVSPEGNPSGGNRLRGLYNIALKSLGAAMKKDPATALTGVLEYGERFNAPGYYFMDSPGNDLESIAGQIATGCNLIFFVTGNGSITNFPFVPTLKVVTTTARYELLRDEMDINAGDYLTGKPLHLLGQETYELMRQTASGALSKGELAGHTQVQIWRDWSGGEVPAVGSEPLAGRPILVGNPQNGVAFETAQHGKIGLVLPTSLCSGQVARMVVERLNMLGVGRSQGVERFVTLVHTEGCGASSNTADLFDRTLLGYIGHRLVRVCLLLEHGCEKTHNDYFRQRLGDSAEKLGFASIQQDGGISNVIDKIETWFQAALQKPYNPPAPAAPRIALAAFGSLSPASATQLADLTYTLLNAGCSVILPQHNSLLNSDYLPETRKHAPTLAYGQVATETGLHIMQMPTTQWGEVVTGLGVSADLIVAFSEQYAPQVHPFVPVLRVGSRDSADFDAVLGADQLTAKIGRILNGTETPIHSAQTFQIARGELGISL